MLKTFDSLNASEQERLRNSHSGNAKIVVHPYWFSDNEKFEEFLSKNKASKDLILIFEEHSKVTELEERLSPFAKSLPENIYLVKTKLGYADPICGWQRIIGRLHSLGIKKVDIGGHLLLRNFLLPGRVIKWVSKSMVKKGTLNKADYSQARTTSRAAFPIIGVPNYICCVGDTYSKIKSSGLFKTNITNAFGKLSRK